MEKEKLIQEVERLRTASSCGRLMPTDFDNLMKMLGAETWAEVIGEVFVNFL
jgi:hypothetical protein